MKKRIFCLILSLATACAPLCAHAMLTEEEQLYYRAKRAQTEAVPKSGKETEAESEKIIKTAAETKPEKATEAATEPETEKVTEAVTEEATEAASESETDMAADEDAPLVALDPGHEAPDQDMSGEEPNGPGSDVARACMTPGTAGKVSGLAEYELNLDICLQLKEELQKRGYRVLLTRETHDVSLSDVERCQIANEADADIFIHIHGNTSEDLTATGAIATSPSYTNPYVADHYDSSMKLADDVLDTYCEVTGLNNRGIYLNDNLTSINWSEMPVTILELGYMSNEQDDAYMADAENQKTMVQGIADGIDKYFGRLDV